MPVLAQYQLLLPSDQNDPKWNPFFGAAWHKVLRSCDEVPFAQRARVAVTSTFEWCIEGYDIAIRRPEGTELLMEWWDGFTTKGGDLEGWQLVKANLGAQYPTGLYA